VPSITDFSILTFDCYGTLIDWEQGILAELRPWAARHGITAGDDELLEAFGAAEAACEHATPARLYPQILEDVMRQLARRWSVAVSDEEAADFGSSVGRWPAFPDSPGALNYLSAHYKLVIISNVDHQSFAKSQEKLGVRFDRVITAQDIGSYKPDLRNFRYALDDIRWHLGAEPGQVLHTAQSIFHDIVPAKHLGLRTMWINRRKGREGWGATPPPNVGGDATTPDFEVSSMAEFAASHGRTLAARL
jgi:2-haloalkanoic acid dehalogenase type II